MIYKPLLKNKQKNDSPEYVPGTEIYGFESLLENPSELLQEDPLLLKEDVLDPTLGNNKNADSSKTPKTSKTSTNFSSPNEFKNTMLTVYTKILQEKGIDTSFAKVLSAQDALESGWGNKTSGINNFGGVKSTNGSGTVKTTKEYINGQYVTISDTFRDFNSIEDYARYKVNLLNSSRYNVFAHPVSEFAFWVKRGGYATDPNYTSVLNNVINSFRQGGIIDSRWPWLKNNYFKNGGVLRFSTGGTGPGLDKALSDQVSLPTGSFGSNITQWSLEKLNRDYAYDIYRPHLEKIVDTYGDSLFVNDNSLSKREKIDFLYSLRGELASLDVPKEFIRDFSSLTKYFKNYIDSHTIGYKKETKLPDGSISTAYFDKNKKYLRRDGTKPKDLNEGVITINVDNNASKLNPHALAELYARYHGIPIARNGMKIKKCATGGISPEGNQWVKDQNGAARYYKSQVESGKSTAPFAPFYYRMRYGYDGDNGLYLPDGEAFAIVKNTHNGKPIVYSEIMQDGDHLVDYRNNPKKAYDIAIKTGNYLTVPSDKIANEFVSNYRSLTDWFPVFKGTTSGSVPATGTKSVDKYDISWEPDPNFIPTIEDLARQLTMSYEDYRAKPYILKTKKKDGAIFEQELIGHGIADPDTINKYRATGIPRKVSEQWVINNLNNLYKSLGKQEPNFYNLPWNVQLAILDAAYNTSGESFWANSKKLAGLVKSGVTDPNKLVTELDHSKSAGGWLGDRSAARRALALGQFRWNWKYIDEFGRHYNPNIPLGSQDYLRALYLGNY